jgi:ethanolamine utilization protein EutM
MARSAIGLVETRGLVGLIAAADVAAKVAQVELLGFERIGGGLVSLRLAGDVGSVQVAVQAAAEAAAKLGEVISCHVIPAPHVDLVGLLAARTGPVAAAVPEPVAERSNPRRLETLSAEALAELPVTRLRQLARQVPELALKGRAVSRANKQQLIAALVNAWQ